MKDTFEDLIQTLERNAVDNQVTITNVKLWAESWRKERELEMKNQRYSPLQEFLMNEKEYGDLFDNPDK